MKAIKGLLMTVEHGAKAFSVIEFFLALYNLVYLIIFGLTLKMNDLTSTNIPKVVHGVIVVVFCTIVAIQVVLGLILYPIGWVKRNIAICLAWIVVALLNVVFILVLWTDGLISYATSDDDWMLREKWDFWIKLKFWHLFYNIIGAAVMIKFVKWVKESKGVVKRPTELPHSLMPTSTLPTVKLNQETKTNEFQTPRIEIGEVLDKELVD